MLSLWLVSSRKALPGGKSWKHAATCSACISGRVGGSWCVTLRCKNPTSVCASGDKAAPATKVCFFFPENLNGVRPKTESRCQKEKGWEAPRNTDETYCHLRPALRSGVPQSWAAPAAANPQSWTCLDATWHVDSLRQERKKVGDVFSCYTPLIQGCLGQDPLVCPKSSWPQQKTPYCLHSFSTTLFIWEPEELGGSRTGATWGRSLLQLLTFREDKKRRLLQSWRRKKTTDPSFYICTTEGLDDRKGGLSTEETWSTEAPKALRRVLCHSFDAHSTQLPDSSRSYLKLDITLGFQHQLRFWFWCRSFSLHPEPGFLSYTLLRLSSS